MKLRSFIKCILGAALCPPLKAAKPPCIAFCDPGFGPEEVFTIAICGTDAEEMKAQFTPMTAALMMEIRRYYGARENKRVVIVSVVTRLDLSPQYREKKFEDICGLDLEQTDQVLMSDRLYFFDKGKSRMIKNRLGPLT